MKNIILKILIPAIILSTCLACSESPQPVRSLDSEYKSVDIKGLESMMQKTADCIGSRGFLVEADLSSGGYLTKGNINSSDNGIAQKEAMEQCAAAVSQSEGRAFSLDRTYSPEELKSLYDLYLIQSDCLSGIGFSVNGLQSRSYFIENYYNPKSPLTLPRGSIESQVTEWMEKNKLDRQSALKTIFRSCPDPARFPYLVTGSGI